MTTIFLDECGFTGQDLLHKEQPFFVLASLNIEEEESKSIKARFFSQVKSTELKHSSLSKYYSQQRSVLEFLSYILSRQQLTKVAVTDKKYALTCKIVDLVIETALYLEGIDLYDKGGNIGLANLLHLGLPAVTSEMFFNNLLYRFQEMLRSPSQENYNRFIEVVFQTQNTEPAEELVGYIRAACYRLQSDLLSHIPENPLDIALSLAYGIMGSWRKETTEPITLIHDTSSNMSKQRYIWDALMSPDIPSVTIGYDRRTMQFPINIQTTLFEKSEDWVSLQLTDILAGAFARAAKWQTSGQNPKDTYGADLVNILGQYPIIPLIPQIAFTSEELNTIGDNAVDPNLFIAEIIGKANKLGSGKQ